jgi:Na+/H+ antiporter NhaD/arsenite permease-like protein
VARGEPLAILLLLSGVTALLSAFLDNVTTIVLLIPVTLYIATTLRLSPIPFVLAEVLASNIGGTATLIGDPPNILIPPPA